MSGRHSSSTDPAAGHGSRRSQRSTRTTAVLGDKINKNSDSKDTNAHLSGKAGANEGGRVVEQPMPVLRDRRLRPPLPRAQQDRRHRLPRNRGRGHGQARRPNASLHDLFGRSDRSGPRPSEPPRLPAVLLYTRSTGNSTSGVCVSLCAFFYWFFCRFANQQAAGQENQCGSSHQKQRKKGKLTRRPLGATNKLHWARPGQLTLSALNWTRRFQSRKPG